MKQLTDEECEVYRKAPLTFHAMIRKIWEDGYKAGAASQYVAPLLSVPPEKCQHRYSCVNDGKHGRDEEWVCSLCGDREYR